MPRCSIWVPYWARTLPSAWWPAAARRPAAERLRHLRQEKLYKRCTEKWDDFCPKYLKISRVEADRTIKLWEKFGPAYFELSQLTRVSPQTFRAIAPAIQDGASRYNGETIALNAENSRKVAAAVAGLRRSLPKRSPDMDLKRRIAKLEKTCAAVIAEFESISSHPGMGAVRMVFQSALTSARAELGRVAKDNGLA